MSSRLLSFGLAAVGAATAGVAVYSTISGKGAHEVVSDMLGLSAAATEEPEQIEVDQGSMAFSGADLDGVEPAVQLSKGQLLSRRSARNMVASTQQQDAIEGIAVPGSLAVTAAQGGLP
ncbi:hypothetical protein T484DRAFT_1781778 [Baffinella frigidus]|nr:hypothetical protein T484DRAFT_1781778 [Cryptophyta sp. CCMP2293]